MPTCTFIFHIIFHLKMFRIEVISSDGNGEETRKRLKQTSKIFFAFERQACGSFVIFRMVWVFRCLDYDFGGDRTERSKSMSRPTRKELNDGIGEMIYCKLNPHRQIWWSCYTVGLRIACWAQNDVVKWVQNGVSSNEWAGVLLQLPMYNQEDHGPNSTSFFTLFRLHRCVLTA